MDVVPPAVDSVTVAADNGAITLTLSEPVEAAALRKSSAKLFGFTANLHVNYRKPVFVGTTVVIECALDRVEGRKRFLQGKMTCAKTGAHLADATALFVLPRS